jgi:hypothetical protein
MSEQFEATQRAYLSAKDAEIVLGTLPVFSVPIDNSGHVPSRHISIHMNYLRLRVGLPSPDPIYLDNRTMDSNQDTVINPGSRVFAITVTIPQLTDTDIAAVMARTQQLLIRARITYDTGFKKTDMLTIPPRPQTRNSSKGFSGGVA